MNHPAIIGWQTDNEFCHDTRCYCETCAQKFRAWLKARYKTIDELNQAWGAVFWSQTYSNWDEIQPSNLTVTEANPSHALDYYRFSSDTVVAYQQIQIDILRSTVSRSQFVTHNLMGTFPDLDYHDLSQPLDFVTWDSYPTGYQETTQLYNQNETRPVFAHDVGDPYVTGFCHDLTRGIKKAPYWVMEQQAGNINWAIYNPGIRPGTVRLWTWHALASGADAVVYFRWRACLFAQEQYHSGLLHHDASPDVGYDDVVAMKNEWNNVESNWIDAGTGRLLHDYDDLWACAQPHNKDFAYQRHLCL
jgi:beta-galactosidase